ncbi:hypothetical protein [Paenibacillus sp. FSL H7-0331]|uniref:hypothetical protein n=1 Tax=Paenibacillus sp. FSL H7-0331 TaxID=1920421 RepID=UPI0015C39EE8|nr:hypothetical protein [Paenibacillus sp. FSL H7-0331]
MTNEEMNQEYKEACKKQLRDDLLREIEEVLYSDKVSERNKDWTFSIIASILIKAKELG